MSRDPRLYLGDILEAIGKVLQWTEGLDQSSFTSDELVFDACLRNLEIIGEAVKGLPREITEANSHIEWRVIGAFRNRLAHGYFSVDRDLVWNVITNRLPALKTDIASLLMELNVPPST